MLTDRDTDTDIGTDTTTHTDTDIYRKRHRQKQTRSISWYEQASTVFINTNFAHGLLVLQLSASASGGYCGGGCGNGDGTGGARRGGGSGGFGGNCNRSDHLPSMAKPSPPTRILQATCKPKSMGNS